jgi:hypothetical protein
MISENFQDKHFFSWEVYVEVLYLGRNYSFIFIYLKL